ncbi:hypothetical protein L6164_029397 [Bauhinia variegata]|nr:hypothetical protein L6164_029397 [Bauhinia variegata]
MLGLKLREQSTSGRARRLYARLKNEKILIILDGVWNSLDFEAIGIPTATDHKGCKILVTTQNENIWRAFGAGTKKVAINPLSEEESWRLFKSFSGDIVDAPPFNVVAKDIVGKCKGLPVMLVEIGKKLKGKGIEQWRDMNRQIDYSEKKGENLDDFLDDFI